MVFRIWWRREGGESAEDITLDHPIAGLNSITGIWDPTSAAYFFEIDTTVGAEWDPSEPYQICEDGGIVVSNIVIPDPMTRDEFNAHKDAATLVHGIAAGQGSLVGTDKSQTLKNKTLKNSENTLLEVYPSSLVWGGDMTKSAPAIAVRPAPLEDTFLHFVSASSTDLTIAVKNSDGSADRKLNISASEVHLRTNVSGSAIKLTGLANGTAGGDAVNYTQFSSLVTRVTALEEGGEWAGTPRVTQAITGPRNHFRVTFTVDPTNITNVTRYEVFSAPGTMGDFAGGLRSSNEVDFLRANFYRKIVRRQEGGSINGQRDHDHFITLAFDINNVAYSSAETVAAEGGDSRYLRATETGAAISIAMAGGGSRVLAAAADGSEAAGLVTWIQTNTTFKTKSRELYTHNSNNKTLRFKYRAYCVTTSQAGYIRVAVENSSGSIVKEMQLSVPYAATIPTVFNSADLDISTGITEGEVYTLAVALKGEGSTTEIRMTSDISLTPLQYVPVW